MRVKTGTLTTAVGSLVVTMTIVDAILPLIIWSFFQVAETEREFTYVTSYHLRL